MPDYSDPGHKAWELNVTQRHTVSESGVKTHTDVQVPPEVDYVSERLARKLWDEFGTDAEDDLGLDVVDE